MLKIFLLLVIALLALTASAFKPSFMSSRNVMNLSTSQSSLSDDSRLSLPMNNLNIGDEDLLVFVLKTSSVAAALYPTVAFAGIDSSPVVVPLVISALTIIPFVFYAQALKPKERTVKQIELDENLRPVDKNLKKGKTGEARAGSKKK